MIQVVSLHSSRSLEFYPFSFLVLSFPILLFSYLGKYVDFLLFQVPDLVILESKWCTWPMYCSITFLDWELLKSSRTPYFLFFSISKDYSDDYTIVWVLNFFLLKFVSVVFIWKQTLRSIF